MLLPAALIRLTLNIDLRAMLRLGPKLLAMYLGASLSIMLGAVVAFWVMRWLHPATVAGNTWAGMADLARSWIGGGANMRVMREVFDVDATTFGQFAVVDVGVGYVWMAVLIFLAGRARNIDARSGADIRALDALQERMARFQAEHAGRPDGDCGGVAFGGVGLARALANPLAAWCKAQLSWASQFSLDTPFVCVGGCWRPAWACC
ncbi:integral membrane protein [Xanthomonas oryzae pv. oryzicola]|nr:integral membrane protein [Xanthomonas oryzae pv. oryzicola]